MRLVRKIQFAVNFFLLGIILFVNYTDNKHKKLKDKEIRIMWQLVRQQNKMLRQSNHMLRLVKPIVDSCNRVDTAKVLYGKILLELESYTKDVELLYRENVK